MQAELFQTETKIALTVELVPSGSWEVNVRAILKPSWWDKLRKDQYARAGHRCEICGGKGKRHPVECHEIWHYDDVNHVQTLMGLIALCPTCHKAKHLGLLFSRGTQREVDTVMRHLARVNGWTVTRTFMYINDVFAEFNERSRHDWLVKVDWLAGRLDEINKKKD